MKKKFIGCILAIIIVIVGKLCFAIEANQLQTIDASQRNQITTSSGGGGVDLTTSNTTYTGVNTFSGVVSNTAPVVNTSTLKVVGTTTLSGQLNATGTNFFSKPVVIGTNIGFASYGLVLDARNVSVPSSAAIVNVGGTAALVIGDIIGATQYTQYDHNGLGIATITHGTATTDEIHNLQNASAAYSFQRSGANMMVIGPGSIAMNTNVTLGGNASDAVTMNASTMSIPNFLNIGSSTLYVSNSTIGVGTALTGSTNGIYFTGQNAQIIGMPRITTAGNNQGKDFTIMAGSCNTNASNTDGGNLILSGGSAGGNGSSAVEIWTAAGIAGGTANRAPTSGAIFKGINKTGGGVSFGLNDTTPEAVCEIAGINIASSNVFMVSSDASLNGDSIKVVAMSSTTNMVGILHTGPTLNTVTIGSLGLVVTNDIQTLGNWVATTTLPAVNQILTNGSRRMYVKGSVYMSTTTGTAACKLIQVTGSTTNIADWSQAGAPSSSEIRPVFGFLNPSDIYIFSNFSTGDGTIALTNFNSKAF